GADRARAAGALHPAYPSTPPQSGTCIGRVTWARPRQIHGVDAEGRALRRRLRRQELLACLASPVSIDAASVAQGAPVEEARLDTDQSAAPRDQKDDVAAR